MCFANLDFFFHPCAFSALSFFTVTLSGCKFALPWFFVFQYLDESHRFLAYYLFLFYINVYMLNFWFNVLEQLYFENIPLNEYSLCFVFFFFKLMCTSVSLRERILQSMFANHCSREGHFYLFKQLLKMHVCCCFKSEQFLHFISSVSPLHTQKWCLNSGWPVLVMCRLEGMPNAR